MTNVVSQYQTTTIPACSFLDWQNVCRYQEFCPNSPGIISTRFYFDFHIRRKLLAENVGIMSKILMDSTKARIISSLSLASLLRFINSWLQLGEVKTINGSLDFYHQE